MRHLQVRKPLLHQRRIRLLPFRSQQPVEQPDVGKYRREELAVVLRFLRAQRFTIQQNFTRLRLVEARQQHRQRGFAAAVTADQEQEFAAVNGQVDRPH